MFVFGTEVCSTSNNTYGCPFRHNSFTQCWKDQRSWLYKLCEWLQHSRRSHRTISLSQALSHSNAPEYSLLLSNLSFCPYSLSISKPECMSAGERLSSASCLVLHTFHSSFRKCPFQVLSQYCDAWSMTYSGCAFHNPKPSADCFQVLQGA